VADVLAPVIAILTRNPVPPSEPPPVNVNVTPPVSRQFVLPAGHVSADAILTRPKHSRETTRNPRSTLFIGIPFCAEQRQLGAEVSSSTAVLGKQRKYQKAVLSPPYQMPQIYETKRTYPRTRIVELGSGSVVRKDLPFFRAVLEQIGRKTISVKSCSSNYIPTILDTRTRQVQTLCQKPSHALRKAIWNLSAGRTLPCGFSPLPLNFFFHLELPDFSVPNGAEC